jgi:hypothetical protein
MFPPSRRSQGQACSLIPSLWVANLFCRSKSVNQSVITKCANLRKFRVIPWIFGIKAHQGGTPVVPPWPIPYSTQSSDAESTVPNVLPVQKSLQTGS